MGEWFWALRGWDLLAVTLSALSAILVAIGSLVIWLGKALTKATAHDQRTCDCWDCKNRRVRATARRKVVTSTPEGRSDGDVFPTSGGWGENNTWLRTVDLAPYTRIMVGNWAYMVVDVVEDQRGYLVQVERLKNRKRAVICITHANIYRRYWKPWNPYNGGNG